MSWRNRPQKEILKKDQGENNMNNHKPLSAVALTTLTLLILKVSGTLDIPIIFIMIPMTIEIMWLIFNTSIANMLQKIADKINLKNK